MRYPATLSDGRSAGAGNGTVGLEADGLSIASGDGVSQLWPYASLSAATPLGAHSRDVLLTSRSQPDATLFVADPAFVAALVMHAKHLKTSNVRWHAARVLIAVAAAIVAIVGVLWWADVSPARSLANLMPDTLRERLGAKVLQSMTSDRRVCAAPDGVAALERLGQRLSTAADDKAKFKIVVVDWSLLNAFAAPGEQIVLTRELVEKATSSDEVAGVLAHEMGHGLERHPETGLIRIIGMSAALEFMMAGSSSTLANVGLLMAQLSYTRAAEQEADDHSLRILKNAGISARGISDFFKRVEKIEGKSGIGKTIGNYDLLRSHPQSAERAKRALDQPPYKTTPALNDVDWQSLQQICSDKPAAKTP
jgi:beta-barrel assembly-enhancing protease